MPGLLGTLLYKGTIGSSIGRIGVGAGIGAGIGVARGDSGTPWQQRAMMGAAVGGAAAMGFNYLSSWNNIKELGRSAGIRIGTNVRSLATRVPLAFEGLIRSDDSIMRSLDMRASELVKGIQRMPIVKTPQVIAGNMMSLAGPVAAMGTMGAGLYGASELARKRRTTRFQASTGGLVQGMHSGRHRGR